MTKDAEPVAHLGGCSRGAGAQLVRANLRGTARDRCVLPVQSEPPDLLSSQGHAGGRRTEFGPSLDFHIKSLSELAEITKLTSTNRSPKCCCSLSDIGICRIPMRLQP